MKIKGFLVLFGPDYGRGVAKDGQPVKYEFNNKFFELEDAARASLDISLAKAKKNNFNWTDVQIVRIETEGKVLGD